MNLSQSESMVSIVIPVYNAEKNISGCLDSVLLQTYNNIEIILIDDGSTDKSAEICADYQKKYSKIRCIYQKNSGPASARNKGIDESKGKYVAFIDSDDTISPDMISTMVDAAESNLAEMVICSYNLIENNKESVCNYKLPEGLYSGEKSRQVLYSLMDEDQQSVPPYSWVRLTLRSVFETNNLRFKDGLIRSEDYHFWTKVHTRIKSVYLLSKTPLYNYICNDESITHSYVKKYWDGVLFIYNDLKKHIPDTDVCRQKLDVMLIKRALISLNNSAMCTSKKQARKEIWKIVNNHQLNSVVKKLKDSNVRKFKSFRRTMQYHGKLIVALKYMYENIVFCRNMKK